MLVTMLLTMIVMAMIAVRERDADEDRRQEREYVRLQKRDEQLQQAHRRCPQHAGDTDARAEDIIESGVVGKKSIIYEALEDEILEGFSKTVVS